MKRLFFILLSFILIVTAIAVPSLAANLFPTTPLDVTLFDYVVYDCDNEWVTVATGHGNTFTYTFQANRNYAIRFASPYLPSSLISAGNTVDYYIINLGCSTSSYSNPKMNAAVFYYNSSGGRIGITDKTYDYVNFDNLPVCNMNFNHGLNSSTFRFVTDFNYFKVSSTKSVTFTLNAFAYGESKGQPVVDAESYLFENFNNGVVSATGYSFPKNYFVTDQRAYDTNRFIQSGYSYTQFNISGNNLVNPPPNNSSSVDSAYDEFGYNFVFYPVGHNFIYFDSFNSGKEIEFGLDISFTSNVDNWARIVEESIFYIDYYDANYSLLGSQAVRLSSASLGTNSVSFDVKLITDVPALTEYVQFYVKSSGWCPLSWNNSGYIKFTLNKFYFTVGSLLGSDAFDDLGNVENILDGELGSVFDDIFTYQGSVLNFFADFRVAFAFLATIFDSFLIAPLFSGLLYLSICIGVFGVLLNFIVSSFNKESSSGHNNKSNSSKGG